MLSIWRPTVEKKSKFSHKNPEKAQDMIFSISNSIADRRKIISLAPNSSSNQANRPVPYFLGRKSLCTDVRFHNQNRKLQGTKEIIFSTFYIITALGISLKMTSFLDQDSNFNLDCLSTEQNHFLVRVSHQKILQVYLSESDQH